MSEIVTIFDTTLRDGEQSPGCSMNLEEKLRMAHQLAKLRVDIIEAGFPIASEGDFESVNRVAREVTGPVICGLARAGKADIDRCFEAVEVAVKRRIHVFLATSPIHMKHKLRKSPEEVVKIAAEAVAYAQSLTGDVEFSAEDATRSEPDFLARVFSEVIAAGASTINVPDTVGYTIPSEFAKLIAYIKNHVKNVDKAVISVHCHNDLGLAVANSLAAIENGARQAECTVNGIGERAGNASMEEIVMTLSVRKDKMPFATNVDARQIYASSKLLSYITGINVQPNKAIVGENAFAHEAGIHQDGVLKYQQTYEIMTPASVGVPRNKLVLGKHSGRHALRDRLSSMGYALDGDALEAVFKSFKDLADKKKNVFDEDIITLVEGVAGSIADKYALEHLHVVAGDQETPTAKVSLKIDGRVVERTETGDGPVDAAFNAVRTMTGFSGNLEKYAVNAITGGTDAQGEVFVTLSQEGTTVRGNGAHTDIVMASVLAFLSALNRLNYHQTKKAGRTSESL